MEKEAGVPFSEQKSIFYYQRESNDRNVLSQSAGIGHSGGEVLPYKRLMGMRRWMGAHFHLWIDYFIGVLLEWGRTFSDFWCKKVTIHGTRHDSQRRFLAQHSVAMLEQCCNRSK